ncbi:MAG: DCC1-like thiol-disulfide oxidoreductase family protein [Halieaceae bacterium]
MPDTLYYDSNCPICVKEVGRLQQIADKELVICDIFQARDDSLPDTDTLLRQLHLQTSDGEFLTGVDANVAAWRHTRWSFLFAWMRWPLVRSVTDRIYARWALWRYQRLYGEQYTGPNDAV